MGVPRLARIRRSGMPVKKVRRECRNRFNNTAATRFALTERESEVMKHLAKGLLYKEIADAMNVSYAAVHKLQRKIFIKLQVRTRTEAVVKWYNHLS